MVQYSVTKGKSLSHIRYKDRVTTNPYKSHITGSVMTQRSSLYISDVVMLRKLNLQIKLCPQKIKEYVLGDNWDPLVIHGESGCGKTSIMAQAAKEAFHWIQGKGMVVMRWVRMAR